MKQTLFIGTVLVLLIQSSNALGLSFITSDLQLRTSLSISGDNVSITWNGNDADFELGTWSSSGFHSEISVLSEVSEKEVFYNNTGYVGSIYPENIYDYYAYSNNSVSVHRDLVFNGYGTVNLQYDGLLSYLFGENGTPNDWLRGPDLYYIVFLIWNLTSGDYTGIGDVSEHFTVDPINLTYYDVSDNMFFNDGDLGRFELFVDTTAQGLYSHNPSASPAPEPSTALLLLFSVGAFAGLRKINTRWPTRS